MNHHYNGIIIFEAPPFLGIANRRYVHVDGSTYEGESGTSVSSAPPGFVENGAKMG